MLVIRTKAGVELRVPVDEIESMNEVEPASGEARGIPPHPYLHREGVNRCAACWQDRLHASHSETMVR